MNLDNFKTGLRNGLAKIRPFLNHREAVAIATLVENYCPSGDCWKAEILGLIHVHVPVSDVVMANIFLILSRLEDEFDQKLFSLGYEKIVGRKFFEEPIMMDMLDGIKLDPLLWERSIILKSELNV